MQDYRFYIANRCPYPLANNLNVVTMSFKSIAKKMRTMTFNSMQLHKIWFAKKENKTQTVKTLDSGSLTFHHRHIVYEGAEHLLEIKNISSIKTLKDPHSFLRKWVEISFKKGKELKTFLFTQPQLWPWHSLVSRSQNLLQEFNRFKLRNPPQTAEIDAVILTPIEPELQAMIKQLEHVEAKKIPLGKAYYQGEIDTKDGRLNVAVLQTGSCLGNITAYSMEAAGFFKPKIMLLVGIAGGLKDVKLGDVVIGTKAYNYEMGKQFAHGFSARFEGFSYSLFALEQAKMVGRNPKWRNRIDYGKHNTMGFSKETIAVISGPIASGNKVIEDINNPIIRTIHKVYNDTVAVEMEAHGLSKVNQYYRHIQLLNIRGISDLIDNKTQTDQQGYQAIAAKNAAAFAAEFLASLEF